MQSAYHTLTKEEAAKIREETAMSMMKMHRDEI